MPGKKTLGSMMNPRPMQFTMGAKMYQNGAVPPPVRDKFDPGMAPDVSGYEEVTGQFRGLGRYFKTPNGDIVGLNELPPDRDWETYPTS